MAVPEKIQQQRNEIVKQIVEDMKSGKPFFWDSGHFMKRPRNLLKDMKGQDQFYHGLNNIRLVCASKKFGFNDSRWATFTQAVEAGGKIKKGAKGIHIEYWQYKKPVLELNPKTGKKEQVYVIDEETGKKLPAYRDLKPPLVKSYVVFNAEQIENIEPEKIMRLTDKETNAAMENMIKNSEAPIFYDQTIGNYYAPGNDTIHLVPREYFKTMDAFYATASHEIAHSTGSEKRLNRPTLTAPSEFGDETYAKEELRAEITSMFLAQKYNIKFDENHYKNHAAYLRSWVNVLENNPNEIFQAASDAEKAMKYIEEKMILKEKTLQKEETAAFDADVSQPSTDRIEAIKNFSVKSKPRTAAQKYMAQAKSILSENNKNWSRDFDKKIINSLVKSGENGFSIQNAVSRFSPIKYKNTEITKMVRDISKEYKVLAR